jgi:hypothetical protein
LVEFPPEVLQRAWVSKDAVDKANRSCTVGCLAVIGIVVAAAVAYVVWRL